jgi:hypothetical protein
MLMLHVYLKLRRKSFLTEEEYSLILSETDTPDPFRSAALDSYRDMA